MASILPSIELKFNNFHITKSENYKLSSNFTGSICITNITIRNFRIVPIINPIECKICGQIIEASIDNTGTGGTINIINNIWLCDEPVHFRLGDREIVLDPNTIGPDFNDLDID